MGYNVVYGSFSPQIAVGSTINLELQGSMRRSKGY